MPKRLLEQAYHFLTLRHSYHYLFLDIDELQQRVVHLLHRVSDPEMFAQVR